MNRKALSLPILISLVIGNMIGTGIYVLPASLAEYGSISLLGWLVTSIGAIFFAITFANLSKRVPKTGGPYIYCKEAFGRLVGFIVAYTYWLGNLVSVAGIAVASIGYLGFILPELNANGGGYQSYTALLLELGAIWFFTLINIIGLHTAGVVQLVLTVLKLVPLFLITIIGIGYVHLDNLPAFNLTNHSNLTALASASALTFWAFIGLEAATVPAENTPGYKAIYIATVFGTLITALIYIASTLVLMGMVPAAQLANSQFPFADAGKILLGSQAGSIIAICAVISGLGALNVCILIQGQIVFAAARDRLFPRQFAKLSRHDVPIAAQLLSSSLVSLFLIMTLEPTLLKQFNNIALLAGVLALFNYCLTALAELKFIWRKRVPVTKKIFRYSTLIASIAVLYAFIMFFSFNQKMLVMGLGAIFLCIPIYFFTVRNYEPT